MPRYGWEGSIRQGTVGKGSYNKVRLGRNYMARYGWEGTIWQGTVGKGIYDIIFYSPKATQNLTCYLLIPMHNVF